MNKKGFTLVEVLVTIVILGIITALSYPAVSNLQARNQTKKYKYYSESIIESSKVFIVKNKEDIFINNRNCYKVTYDDLKSFDLIKDFSDKKINCNNNTYVMVTKNGKKYSYAINILCKDLSGTEVYKDNTASSIECNGGGLNEGTNPTVKIENMGPKPTTFSQMKTAKVTITSNISLKESFAVSYGWSTSLNVEPSKYLVQKVDNPSMSNTVNFSVDTPKRVEGNYYLWVKPNGIENINNKQALSITKSDVFKVDNIAPQCTNSGDSTTWTNKPRTIYYGCIDGSKGSGCLSTANGGSVRYATPGTTVKSATIAGYDIYDNSGNKARCPARTAKVYYDSLAPRCTNSGDSTTWTKSSRTIYYGCTDGSGSSGCTSASNGGSVRYSTPGTTVKLATIAAYDIYDNAGNKTRCPARTAKVYYDSQAPTVPVIENPTNGNLSNTPFSLKISSTDAGIGLNNFDYTYESIGYAWQTYSNSSASPFTTTEFSDERNENVYIRACDKLNNCSERASTKIHIEKHHYMYICRSQMADCGEGWENFPGRTQTFTNIELGYYGRVYMTGTRLEVIDLGNNWVSVKDANPPEFIQKQCLKDTPTCCTRAECTG